MLSSLGIASQQLPCRVIVTAILRTWSLANTSYQMAVTCANTNGIALKRLRADTEELGPLGRTVGWRPLDFVLPQPELEFAFRGVSGNTLLEVLL
jgi:hypothetical protein